MKTIKVDNCKYCGCVTSIDVQDDYLKHIDRLVVEGDIGCQLCIEGGEDHSEFDVFEDGKKVWCGHQKSCADLERSGANVNPPA